MWLHLTLPQAWYYNAWPSALEVAVRCVVSTISNVVMVCRYWSVSVLALLMTAWIWQEFGSTSQAQLTEPRRSTSKRTSLTVMLNYSPLDLFDTVSGPDRIDDLEGLAGNSLKMSLSHTWSFSAINMEIVDLLCGKRGRWIAKCGCWLNGQFGYNWL